MLLGQVVRKTNRTKIYRKYILYYNQKKILELATLPQNRVSMLKRLMDTKNIVRILESHNFSNRSLIIEILKVNKKYFFRI